MFYAFAIKTKNNSIVEAFIDKDFAQKIANKLTVSNDITYSIEKICINTETKKQILDKLAMPHYTLPSGTIVDLHIEKAKQYLNKDDQTKQKLFSMGLRPFDWSSDNKNYVLWNKYVALLGSVINKFPILDLLKSKVKLNPLNFLNTPSKISNDDDFDKLIDNPIDFYQRSLALRMIELDGQADKLVVAKYINNICKFGKT
jgi:hypothetical protein